MDATTGPSKSRFAACKAIYAPAPLPSLRPRRPRRGRCEKGERRHHVAGSHKHARARACLECKVARERGELGEGRAANASHKWGAETVGVDCGGGWGRVGGAGARRP